MGIEPTWERLHAPTPDLKSGSPTSELGASEVSNIPCCEEFGNPTSVKSSALHRTSGKLNRHQLVFSGADPDFGCIDQLALPVNVRVNGPDLVGAGLLDAL